jgi:hypothetical protein
MSDLPTDWVARTARHILRYGLNLIYLCIDMPESRLLDGDLLPLDAAVLSGFNNLLAAAGVLSGCRSHLSFI